MKARLLELLTALEAAIPPPVGHHSITRMKYGSDKDGWEDRLSLNIRVHGGNQAMFLEDGDLEKPVEILVSEIAQMIHDRPPDAQTLCDQSI